MPLAALLFVPAFPSKDELPDGSIVKMTAWKEKHVGCNNNVVHV